jgi:tetratricopeptide (TPR) repeat protein
MRGLREALQAARAAFGARHPTVAAILGNLAVIERAQGELQAAETHQREALEMTIALSGDDHFLTGVSRASLAMLLSEKGDLADSRHEFEQAIRIIEAKVGPDHPDLALWRAAYSDTLLDLGEFALATENAELALRLGRAKMNAADPRLGRIGLSLFRIRFLQGDCSDPDQIAGDIADQLARGGGGMRADRAALTLMRAECARQSRTDATELQQTANNEVAALDYKPRRLRLLLAR